MEHPNDEAEMKITRQMDFIVPLKQIGLITRTVVEAIFCSYQPRRIIVVAPEKEGMILTDLVKLWNTKNVIFVAEESFFEKNFNLKMRDIILEYDINRGGDQREPGWWIQQLIKLGAATQIDNISKHYVVWDGSVSSNHFIDSTLPLPYCRRSCTHEAVAALRSRSGWDREVLHRYSPGRIEIRI